MATIPITKIQIIILLHKFTCSYKLIEVTNLKKSPVRVIILLMVHRAVTLFWIFHVAALRIEVDASAAIYTLHPVTISFTSRIFAFIGVSSLFHIIRSN